MRGVYPPISGQKMKKTIEFQDEPQSWRFIFLISDILDRVFEKITLPLIIFSALFFAAHIIIALIRGNFMF